MGIQRGQERQNMSERVDRKGVLLKPFTYKVCSDMETSGRKLYVHLYPLSLNSKVLSPTFFSETTPRGQEPRTAWRMAGVESKGGHTTRSMVADGKESAKGARLGLDLSE